MARTGESKPLEAVFQESTPQLIGNMMKAVKVDTGGKAEFLALAKKLASMKSVAKIEKLLYTFVDERMAVRKDQWKRGELVQMRASANGVPIAFVAFSEKVEKRIAKTVDDRNKVRK